MYLLLCKAYASIRTGLRMSRDDYLWIRPLNYCAIIRIMVELTAAD